MMPIAPLIIERRLIERIINGSMVEEYEKS